MKGKGIGGVHPRLLAPDRVSVAQWHYVAIDPKQTKLTVTGIDRQKVGQVAAEMRSLRPPDPYKHKGIRYVGERLKKKVGKTGAK